MTRLCRIRPESGTGLSAIANRPKSTILVDILDPSRDISTDFRNYFVATKQG